MAVAALAVFFFVFVSTSVGLGAAPAAQILLVDFVISLLMLLFTRGYWSDIENIATILATIFS